jgi:Protein of unknown function (DUF2971)
MCHGEVILMADPTRDEFLAIWEKFTPLNNRLRLVTSRRHGLLAHYTSVATIEQILRGNQIWLSNPLYMNDTQEMRAGTSLGLQKFPAAAIAAGGSDARAAALSTAYTHYFSHFDTTTAFDTYVFCLCRQKAGDTDGILSMRREYGSRGNGAAIVINLEKVTFSPLNPLLIAEVTYASDTERATLFDGHLQEWINITKSLNLSDDRLYIAARAAFLFTKTIALTTKHRGFEEEHEVRVIYNPDQDPRGYLKPCLDYRVAPRGVEPKLKYKFDTSYAPTDGLDPPTPLDSGALPDLIEFFLLGPTISSALAQKSFIRMLERLNLQAFTGRVFASSIPLRPT